MFTPDILTMVLGFVISGVLKIMKSKMEMQRQTMDIVAEKAGLAKEAADAAAARTSGPWGAWTRRVIALTVISYLFVAPLLLMLFRPEVNIIYAYTEPSGTFLWFASPDEMKFIEAQGFTILPFQRQLASLIAGFYFGAGVAK